MTVRPGSHAVGRSNTDPLAGAPRVSVRPQTAGEGRATRSQVRGVSAGPAEWSEPRPQFCCRRGLGEVRAAHRRSPTPTRPSRVGDCSPSRPRPRPPSHEPPRSEKLRRPGPRRAPHRSRCPQSYGQTATNAHRRMRVWRVEVVGKGRTTGWAASGTKFHEYSTGSHNSSASARPRHRVTRRAPELRHSRSSSITGCGRSSRDRDPLDCSGQGSRVPHNRRA